MGNIFFRESSLVKTFLKITKGGQIEDEQSMLILPISCVKLQVKYGTAWFAYLRELFLNPILRYIT